jgi:hypothetical protein
MNNMDKLKEKYPYSHAILKMQEVLEQQALINLKTNDLALRSINLQMDLLETRMKIENSENRDNKKNRENKDE